MRLVLGRDAMVATWVAHHIAHVGDVDGFGPCAAIGVESDDGQPLGGVVYSQYQPAFRSIEISCAATSRRWLTRPLVRGIMSYPFDQLHCQRVTAITPRRNKPSRSFLETFGFKREGLIRKGFGDDDAVIYGLLEKEWRASRWVQEKPEAHRRGVTLQVELQSQPL